MRGVWKGLPPPNNLRLRLNRVSPPPIMYALVLEGSTPPNYFTRALCKGLHTSISLQLGCAGVYTPPTNLHVGCRGVYTPSMIYAWGLYGSYTCPIMYA